MSIINEIMEKKRQRLKEAQELVPLRDVRKKAEQAEEPRDFGAAIGREEGAPLRLIAELKKASPSKGLIRPDFDPAAIAHVYAGKVDAVSVLTEEDYFQGGLDLIGLVRAACPQPVLRKDFIFDEYQVYEARAAGADAILLIAMALPGSQAEELMELANELEMDVLFEVHEFEDLERALEMEAPIIGVNNRDLRTLEVDLEHTLEIMREVPGGVTVVSESGISTREDVIRLEEAEVDAMLVGTAFMLEDDIAGAIDRLRGNA
jgi:indole-3-glycerol phosphate synthase